MFEDLELDYKTIIVSFIFWILIVIMIWKFSIGGTVGQTTKLKIISTILSAPVIYIVTAIQLNR